MLKVVGETILTWEEFTTIINQIEAILNSRPLAPLSDDPNDLNPLTPSHFLIGRPITTIPEPSLLNLQENRLNVYERLQKITQLFWIRWKKEHIQQLQTRHKWKIQNNTEVKDVALAILIDDNAPSTKWSLPRCSMPIFNKIKTTKIGRLNC